MLNTIKRMWSRFQDRGFTGVIEAINETLSRFQNREFMEAVIAGGVLVSTADGNIDASEKQKIMELVQRIEKLKHFDFQEIAISFANCVEILNFDFTVGKEELLKRIRKIKDHDTAKMIIRICCSVGEADGKFDDVEKNIVREICHQLNLNPADFEL